MNKETEEVVLIAVIAFVFLRLLGTSSTSALAQQKLSASADTAYAGDAAGVLTTLINDTTGD